MKKTEKTTQLNWIRWLQVIGIISVVLGHSLPEDVISMNPNIVVWIRNFGFSFSMPLFFTLSGFLYLHTSQKKYSSLVQQKIERLIIPYIFFGLIAFIPFYLLQNFSSRTVTLSPLTLIYSFIFPQLHSIRYYWYLPVLFIFFLLTPMFKLALKQKHILVLVCALLLASNIFRPISSRILGADYAGVFMIYFFLGMLLKKYQNMILPRISGTLPLFCSSILFCLFYWLFWTGIAQTKPLNHSFEFLLGLTGVTALLGFALRMKKTPMLVELVSLYSYQIFLLSIFPQVAFKILYSLDIIAYWFALVLMCISGITFPILISYTVKNYFPVFKKILAIK